MKRSIGLTALVVIAVFVIATAVPKAASANPVTSVSGKLQCLSKDKGESVTSLVGINFVSNGSGVLIYVVACTDDTSTKGPTTVSFNATNSLCAADCTFALSLPCSDTNNDTFIETPSTGIASQTYGTSGQTISCSESHGKGLEQGQVTITASSLT